MPDSLVPCQCVPPGRVGSGDRCTLVSCGHLHRRWTSAGPVSAFPGARAWRSSLPAHPSVPHLHQRGLLGRETAPYADTHTPADACSAPLSLPPCSCADPKCAVTQPRSETAGSAATVLGLHGCCVPGGKDRWNWRGARQHRVSRPAPSRWRLEVKSRLPAPSCHTGSGGGSSVGVAVCFFPRLRLLMPWAVRKRLS